MNPLVTVLIPTFNYAHYLPESVDSVAQQTFRDFEIIVVDDGSVDETAAVVAGLRCPNLRYVRHEQNLGPPAARNSGLAIARGRFVALLDADDAMKPSNLARKVEVLERHQDVALVHGPVEPMDERSRPLGRTRADDDGEAQIENLFPEILHGNLIACSSVLARKEAIDEVGGFDPRLRYAEDWDLWVRLAHRFRFAYLPAPLVRYRIHVASMQWAAWKGGDDLAAGERTLKKVFAELELEREGFSFDRLYWQLYFRRLGNQAEGLPFGLFARLFFAGALTSPRDALRRPGIKAGLKLLARGVLPRSVLLRWRLRRYVRRITGERHEITERLRTSRRTRTTARTER